ncbi:serine/threonine protein kinase [Halalkalibacter alkaliphilus]|uniref:Protein kinase family protein n=1 Tax=Halalkalibacter alkaliphilus TaxID=2917993 RepID=A0A9X2I739_9BACI|nr:protein kinase family protein [Halalkalibacter alkaliphilus]MCL7749257.1 protein kinase family protein [Halalkalibacter alkaliphilus]
MKNSYSKNQVCKLQSGAKVVGKWHSHPYKIIRPLGAGATGSVYLADSAKGLVALKVGMDSMSITSEVNVLKHFSKVQGQILGPSLLDVDDFVTSEGTFPFYVMEYLKGTQFIEYMQNKGAEWLGILMIQLLGDLDRLHTAGWVFGDLKPDNVLVVGPPARIRWLDVGGTTLVGRSIKEYTEFYDRGYWGQGSRKAEPSYDLFAVAMMMINCAYPSRFEKQGEKTFAQLKQRIDEKALLIPYRDVILKALQGKYHSAIEMRKDMVKAVSKSSSYKHIPVKEKIKQKSKPKQAKGSQKQSVQKKEKKSSYFVEIFLLSSFLLLAYILYLFGQMM